MQNENSFNLNEAIKPIHACKIDGDKVHRYHFSHINIVGIDLARCNFLPFGGRGQFDTSGNPLHINLGNCGVFHSALTLFVLYHQAYCTYPIDYVLFILLACR